MNEHNPDAHFCHRCERVTVWKKVRKHEKCTE